MKKTVIAIAVCLSLLLSACGMLAPVEPTEAPQESNAPKVEENKPDWQVAFEYVLSISDESDEYLLYDLDADGEPEMMTRVGSGDNVENYTYDWAGDGSVTKAYVFSGYNDIAGYRKDGTVLFRVNGGTEKVYKLNYVNGAGRADLILTRELKDGDQALDLAVMPMHSVTDPSGLDWSGDPADENDKVLAAYEEQSNEYVEGPGDKPTYDGEIIDWIGTYSRALGDFGKYGPNDTAKYCIYDLDDDGIPEMLVIFGGSTTEQAIYVIDAKFGGIVTKTQVLEGSANVAGLCSENAVLLHRVHMGTEHVYKIVYVGAQYKAVEVIDSRPLESATDALKFSYLTMHDFSELDGIYWPGNPSDRNDEILAGAN